MKIITINVPERYLELMDKLVNPESPNYIFPSRSELIREAIGYFLTNRIEFENRVTEVLGEGKVIDVRVKDNRFEQMVKDFYDDDRNVYFSAHTIGRLNRDVGKISLSEYKRAKRAISAILHRYEQDGQLVRHSFNNMRTIWKRPSEINIEVIREA